MDELVGKITADIAHYMTKNDLQLVVGAGLPSSHPEHLRGFAEVACKTIMDAAVRRTVERSLADNDKILPGAGEPVMDEGVQRAGHEHEQTVRASDGKDR